MYYISICHTLLFYIVIDYDCNKLYISTYLILTREVRGPNTLQFKTSRWTHNNILHIERFTTYYYRRFMFVWEKMNESSRLFETYYRLIRSGIRTMKFGRSLTAHFLTDFTDAHHCARAHRAVSTSSGPVGRLVSVWSGSYSRVSMCINTCTRSVFWFELSFFQPQTHLNRAPRCHQRRPNGGKRIDIIILFDHYLTGEHNKPSNEYDNNRELRT